MAAVDAIAAVIDDVIHLRQLRDKLAPQRRPLDRGQRPVLPFVLAKPGAGKLDDSGIGAVWGFLPRVWPSS